MPELRHDPVQKRWVIIATERARRPQDFVFSQPMDNGHDCPFCAGNEDATPPELCRINYPDGTWKARCIPNKFPALRVEGELERAAVGQYDRMNGIGAHEVIVESPDHNKDLPDLGVEEIAAVLRIYRERLIDLSRDIRLKYILIFRNHGARAGASLAHPHSQLIATPITPRTVALELESARQHYQVKERCIFCDIIAQEMQEHRRLVLVDHDFVTWCPYASRFPFEMMLAPRRHNHDFSALTDADLLKLAGHLRNVLRRMKASLEDPAYNFLIHTAPAYHMQNQRSGWGSTITLDWHWHIEILPKLSNAAGFEWGTGFYINPTPPEDAAAFLREVCLDERAQC
ncbi:MAG TPA: galactose-1-phosphate uridylyltransferase [Myxococcota bacterium]|nr:galactose-1-phosphate uridylyltransferase [Myxococcota bacterium]HOA14381.1 galactose-1-phosphate uridylyltransferase [Myxococcota bacterium]HOD00778.1 galactose-1-phosphate uridylyltransferase [Myxococcota bacterium]HOH77894.1 galactose-1-phosphate uridylyltransferase [Myxococcota bacterium]HPV04358.1 galactose-1-phosphate uridylyltransferase [Myxococcota bacterium]